MGSVLGTLCAVHCALSGIALASVSFLGSAIVSDERLEYLFIGATLCIGSFAALRGFRKHRSWRPALIFVTAVALVVSAHLMGHDSKDAFMRSVTTIMAVVGAITLVLFHRANNRMCGSCQTKH